MKVWTTIFLCIFAALALTACGGDDDSSEGGMDAILEQDLQFLREEEKLARDVYLTLYDKWGLTQHNNIASSEQTHMDQVKSIMESLGVEDPVVDDTTGIFANSELNQLYTDLVEAGMESETSSVEVGATIEDLDIKDIEEMKSRTTDPSVLNMYSSLQCGSRNHLRTFTEKLDSLDADYTPQYISQEEYDAIIAGPNETCGK